MSRSLALVFGLAVSLLVLSEGLEAQAAYNPYHEIEQWDKLPGGTEFGPLTGGFLTRTADTCGYWGGVERTTVLIVIGIQY